jgi:hypothetical protein
MSGTRDNSGRLSKNDRKEKESHPDIKGNGTIDGVDYWISGWRKENDRGTWYSLSFQRKDQPAEQPAQRGGGAMPGRRPMDDEDSIPFNAEWR